MQRVEILARDALIWGDWLGLKGETYGGKVANSTVAAAVFACKPMVQKMRPARARELYVPIRASPISGFL